MCEYPNKVFLFQPEGINPAAQEETTMSSSEEVAIQDYTDSPVQCVNENKGCIEKHYQNVLVSKVITKYNLKEKRNYPSLVDNASPRRHKLLNENHGGRHEISSCELLVREAPKAYKTTQATAIALGYPS